MQHAKNQPGSFMHLEIRVPHIHIFYHSDPGVLKVVLTFLQFTSVCNKSAQFIHSFIHWPCDLCATTICDHTQPNIFLSTLNFWYQHVKKCRLSSFCSRYIFDLNLSVWLANTNLIVFEWETTNRFTDFTFGWKMIGIKKTKNAFHYQIIAIWC